MQQKIRARQEIGGHGDACNSSVCGLGLSSIKRSDSSKRVSLKKIVHPVSWHLPINWNIVGTRSCKSLFPDRKVHIVAASWSPQIKQMSLESWGRGWPCPHMQRSEAWAQPPLRQAAIDRKTPCMEQTAEAWGILRHLQIAASDRLACANSDSSSWCSLVT